VLLSLGKNENKIKNLDENPADTQVDCNSPIVGQETNVTSKKNYWCHIGR